MKKHRTKVDYFTVEGTPGGSQDWFDDYWMKLAGCGALAACDTAICLSRNKGLRGCCPFDPLRTTRSQYVDLGMRMKRYIRPRIGGVYKTSKFIDGLGKYLRDLGYQAEFEVCPGESAYEEACHFVVEAMDRNLPIAYLMLHHRDPAFKNLDWHWFMVTGYQIREGRMLLTYHTYGSKARVDFERLWDTGHRRKGGLVAVRNVSKLTDGCAL